MIGITRARVIRVLPAALLMASLVLVSAPVFADRYTSTNYVIDASTMNSFGGQGTSTSYKLVSSGGEAVIGNGTGGSYKLGQGYVAQLEPNATPSMQLAVQPAGLLAYYGLNEANGSSTVADSSANSYTANIVGTPVLGVAGKIGTAMTPSSGNYYQTSATTAFNTSYFTACAWTYHVTNSTNPVVLSRSDASSTNGMWTLGYGAAAAPRAQINMGGTTSTVTGSALSTSAWHHICQTYDGASQILYADGVSAATASLSGALPGVSSPLTIGARSPGGNPYLNTIDEVKVFNRALTVEEVKAEYDAGVDSVTAGLGLGTVTPGTSKTANFDSIVKATSTAGYNLAVSQSSDLATPGPPSLNFNESFTGISSGTTLTTSNTDYTSILDGNGLFTANTTSPIYAAFARNVNGGGGATNMRYTYGSPPSSLYSRVYLRINALPASTTTLFLLRDGSTNPLSVVRLNTSGTIVLRNGNTTVGTTSTQITAGQWFRIELQTNVTSGSQTLRLFSGAGLESSTPTETVSGAVTNAAIADIAVGFLSTDNNTLDIDEMATSTAGWIGSASLTSNTIPAVSSGTIASPAAWSEGTTKGLGFSLNSAPSLDSKWSSGANYAALPGSSTTFYSRSGALTNQTDVIAMRARLDVTNVQAAGDYKNTVTIVGTTLP